MEAEKRKALSMYLRDIRDPRRRQGRIYPLASILTMLTLAAVNGESTLRGMWKWAEQHWERIRDRLELEWAESPPQYGTLWNVMARVELRHVEEAVRRWLKDSLGEAISVDASGSRRELPALSMVVAAGQKVQLVLAQEEVKGENVIEAALRLIQGEGRVVTLDAGLNQREIADAIVKKGGLLRGCEGQSRPTAGDIAARHPC
jgi:hypothetical protein